MIGKTEMYEYHIFSIFLWQVFILIDKNTYSAQTKLHEIINYSHHHVHIFNLINFLEHHATMGIQIKKSTTPILWKLILIKSPISTLL